MSNIKNCKEHIDFENRRINKVQQFKYLWEIITPTATFFGIDKKNNISLLIPIIA